MSPVEQADLTNVRDELSRLGIQIRDSENTALARTAESDKAFNLAMLEMRKEVSLKIDNLTEKFDNLRERMTDRRATPWATIIAFASLVVMISAAEWGIAIRPLSNDVTRHEQVQHDHAMALMSHDSAIAANTLSTAVLREQVTSLTAAVKELKNSTK